MANKNHMPLGMNGLTLLHTVFVTMKQKYLLQNTKIELNATILLHPHLQYCKIIIYVRL